MLALRSVRIARRQWTIQACRYSSNTARGPFNVLFCGSDEFSIGSLRAVLEAKDVWQTLHVVTPAPQRTGRGGSRSKNKREEHKSALQLFAEEHGLATSPWPASRSKALSTSSPGSSGAPTAQDTHPSGWSPTPPFDAYDGTNLLLTASFGHIIPNSLLDKFDAAHRLNVHPSLLPKYRGAAPLQWAILNGDESLGISVQRLVEKGKGIDAGEVIGTTDGIEISPSATFPGLIAQTAPLGGELLVRCLRDIIAGTSTARSQDESQKTRAPKVGKETSRIDWSKHTAPEINRMHRALHYHHPIWTTMDGKAIQLLNAEPASSSAVPYGLRSRIEADSSAQLEGTAWLDERGLRIWIRCQPASGDPADGWLQVARVKPEGKKEMGVKDWWNGLGADVKKRGWVRLGN